MVNEIAGELGVGRSTVKTHLLHLFAKTRNKTAGRAGEAWSFVFDAGLIALAAQQSHVAAVEAGRHKPQAMPAVSILDGMLRCFAPLQTASALGKPRTASSD